MIRHAMHRALMLLSLLAACGGSVLTTTDEEGGSAGSSSGDGPCVPCRNTSSSTFFSADRICPGEERDKYEALLACGCTESTCDIPHGGCHEASDAFDLLCDGKHGYVGSGCAGCLHEHCLEERLACKGEEPP